jgi:hypothetical protein
MDRPGHDFLARAGLAGDENGAVGRRDGLEQLKSSFIGRLFPMIPSKRYRSSSWARR